MAGRRKQRKFVPVTNIPEIVTGPPVVSREEQQMATASSHPLIALNLSTSSAALDPADLAILKANESKERRRKEETRLELEKIQERVDYTLSEYQPETPTGQRAETPNPNEVDLHAVSNPEELYKLLRDVRLRTKYQQQVTVLLLGHEAALEDREHLLHSINEFFQETTAGNTEQLLEEISSEEIDLEEAAAGLESALRTAQTAGDRLLQIKKDMGQLFAIVQAFPDTKKGRKKLEKALLKAQEEVESLQSQLSEMQKEMEGGNANLKRLQKQFDTKTTECEKLKKTANQVDQLQRANVGLQSELASTKDALGKARNELEKERKERLQLMAKKAEVKEVVKEVEKVVDDGKVTELESAIAKEKEKIQELSAKLNAQESEFQEKIVAVVAEHEAEIQEMRSRHEEQMKSLMEDDIFSEGESVREDTSLMDELETQEEAVRTAQPESQQIEEKDTSTVEVLRTEFQQRESQLKHELNEVKNKSRKTITGLKAQLVEAQNKFQDGKNDLQKEVDALKSEKATIDAEREEKCQQIVSLEETIVSLENEIKDLAAREEESGNRVKQLQMELQAALTAKFGGGLEKSTKLTQLMNRSAQWSERSLSPASHDQHHSTPPFPIQPMDEVPLSCDPSIDQVDHFDNDGGTPHSVQPWEEQTPFSEGSGIPGGVQFFHGSPDQTGSSQQLLGHQPTNAITNLTSVPGPAPQGLHMLIQSRLSHHSPLQGAASLTPDHPLVIEWVKAYDMVLKFRDGVADMLREDSRFENEADDICSIEGVPLQKDEEIQGQITQMRFSLTLMLHQIEGALQETFGKLLRLEGVGEAEEEGEVEGDGEIKSLKQAKSRLQEKLKKTENMHHIELQESKETIANLSNKVEMLRMEVANLRRSMAAKERDRNDKAPLSMFTSLDLEHNTHELESALESDKITAEAYEKVKKEMNEYLSVPVQRLAQVSKRTQQRKLKDKLVREVQKEFNDHPGKMEDLVERIKSRDNLQQKAFEKTMEGLRQKRTLLAGRLTVQLGEVEQLTKSLLIKPIYGAHAKAEHQDLITPLPRPIPEHRITHQPGGSRAPRSRTKSAVIVSSRSPQNKHRTNDPCIKEEKGYPVIANLKTSPTSSHQTHPSPREWNEWRDRRREEESVSNQESPLPPPYLHTHSLLGRDTRTQPDNGVSWQVDESCPPTRQESLPFSPLMFHSPPVIPGIIDINKTRKRYLTSLMKELGLSSPATPTSRPHTDQSTSVQSKLVLHRSQDPESRRQSRARSLSCPRTPSLPPISVPSRINGQAISTALY